MDASSQKIANRVQGGKRPLSSMSPMIVFDAKNQPVLALGSPGGRSIISYVARVLYEVLVLGRSLPQSIAAGHVVEAGNKVRVESAVSEDTVKALGDMGHVLDVREQTSGIHAIYKTSLGWQGVADPRREGTASGR
jgi:gamma-glutamyltranspeptidase/glutathione hydrolase